MTNRRTYIAASTFLGIIATIALIGIPGQSATATHPQVTGSATCVDGLVNLAVTVSGDPGRDYRGIEATIVSESMPTTPSILNQTVKGDELVQSSTVVGLEYAATYTFEVAVQFANHAAGDLVTNRAVITPTFTECLPPLDVCPNVDGNQATVPDGLVLVDGNCVTPPIVCPDGTVVDGVCVTPPVDPPGCDPTQQACSEVPPVNPPTDTDPLVKTGPEETLAAAIIVGTLLAVGVPFMVFGIRRRHQIRKA